MGVISGDMLIDGHPQDDSFQRKTGYVQQQDLHFEPSTVRESLTFSALLRQPKTTPKAVVGVPGEGLNVEQRKRLTIGVELAAKPDLLLFFDEPTRSVVCLVRGMPQLISDASFFILFSRLDSQTAWSICGLMRKLANNGQAILCMIHQPSAILMQEFDRLLFLAAGGRTVYFGEVGENCTVPHQVLRVAWCASLSASGKPCRMDACSV